MRRFLHVNVKLPGGCALAADAARRLTPIPTIVISPRAFSMRRGALLAVTRRSACFTNLMKITSRDFRKSVRSHGPSVRASGFYGVVDLPELRCKQGQSR